MTERAGIILGTWEFTSAEMEIMGLRTGDVLGPGIVGFATDDPAVNDESRPAG